MKAGLLEYDPIRDRFSHLVTGDDVAVAGRQPRRVLTLMMADPERWWTTRALAAALGNTVSPPSQTVRAALYKTRTATKGLVCIAYHRERGYRIGPPKPPSAVAQKQPVPNSVIGQLYPDYARGNITLRVAAERAGLSKGQIHRRFEAYEDRARIGAGFGEWCAGRQESACPHRPQSVEALPARRRRTTLRSRTCGPGSLS